MHPKLGFIGQGWIGKNYADNFEQRGFSVTRYAKEEPFNKNEALIGQCDIVFIAVPTPTTVDGFNCEILREVLKLIGRGKIAVIKSTVMPGTTEMLQGENPDIFVFYIPEFLEEAKAAYDAANPNRNIIGLPIDTMEYRQKAHEVIDVLPYAPYQMFCSSREAELIKYGGNAWLYLKVVFINIVYDLVGNFGVKWETVRDAMGADPRIGRSHLDPIHKTGRGAGGDCLIKDFAAFSMMYKNMANDEVGLKMLESIKDKNIDLLLSSHKDMELLVGVYGSEILNQSSVSLASSGKKTRCLVTGGAGFIGSNLVDELVARGNEVIVIDNLVLGKRENVNPAAKLYELDIRDLEKIKPLFVGVDYVFHLAALPRVQASIDNPAGTNDTNLTGTLNVLIAARDAKVKKLIYSASSSAYGDQTVMPLREDMKPSPKSPYGLQKYVGELYCRLFNEIYGLPTVSLRYFNIYGQRMPLEGAYCLVMGIFVRQRLAGQSLTICGDGEQRRDFTHVSDAVRANVLAANSGSVGQGEVINIGRGNSYSVNELAQMIGGPTVNLPPRVEPRETLADNTLARELLGWEPQIDLPDWLAEYKKEMGLE